MIALEIKHEGGGVTRIDDACVLQGELLEHAMRAAGVRRKERNEASSK